MIDLEQTDEGVVVPVRAHPKARRNAITGSHAGRVKIAVTDPPERGQANRSIAHVLADVLHVRPSRVHLIAGAASPLKKFLVTGMELGTARATLAAQIVRPGTRTRNDGVHGHR